jgi:hypothetical protein
VELGILGRNVSGHPCADTGSDGCLEEVAAINAVGRAGFHRVRRLCFRIAFRQARQRGCCTNGFAPIKGRGAANSFSAGVEPVKQSGHKNKVMNPRRKVYRFICFLECNHSLV